MSVSYKIWVVYNHPKDYPDDFIARLWEVQDHQLPLFPVLTPTKETIISKDYNEIRKQLRAKGLWRLPAVEEEDLCIIEKWV